MKSLTADRVKLGFIGLGRRGPMQPRKVVPSAHASLEICMQSVNRT